MAQKPVAELARLAGTNGEFYDPSTNPLGLGSGGHRQNFPGRLHDMADVAEFVAASADEVAVLRAGAGDDRTAVAQMRTDVGDMRDGAASSAQQAAASAASIEPETLLSKSGGRMNGPLVIAHQSYVQIEDSNDSRYTWSIDVEDRKFGAYWNAEFGYGTPGYKFQIGLDGSIWTPQLGDLNTRIEDRATGAVALAVSTIRDSVAASYNTLKKLYDFVIEHTSRTNNPHNTTATQVGLGNVANKNEAQMVASGAIATALNGKLNTSGGTMTGVLELRQYTKIVTPNDHRYSWSLDGTNNQVGFYWNAEEGVGTAGHKVRFGNNGEFWTAQIGDLSTALDGKANTGTVGRAGLIEIGPFESTASLASGFDLPDPYFMVGLRKNAGTSGAIIIRGSYGVK